MQTQRLGLMSIGGVLIVLTFEDFIEILSFRPSRVPYRFFFLVSVPLEDHCC